MSWPHQRVGFTPCGMAVEEFLSHPHRRKCSTLSTGSVDARTCMHGQVLCISLPTTPPVSLMSSRPRLSARSSRLLAQGLSPMTSSLRMLQPCLPRWTGPPLLHPSRSHKCVPLWDEQLLRTTRDQWVSCRTHLPPPSISRDLFTFGARGRRLIPGFRIVLDNTGSPAVINGSGANVRDIRPETGKMLQSFCPCLFVRETSLVPQTPIRFLNDEISLTVVIHRTLRMWHKKKEKKRKEKKKERERERKGKEAPIVCAL